MTYPEYKIVPSMRSPRAAPTATIPHNAPVVSGPSHLRRHSGSSLGRASFRRRFVLSGRVLKEIGGMSEGGHARKRVSAPDDATGGGNKKKQKKGKGGSHALALPYEPPVSSASTYG